MSDQEYDRIAKEVAEAIERLSRIPTITKEEYERTLARVKK